MESTQFNPAVETVHGFHVILRKELPDTPGLLPRHVVLVEKEQNEEWVVWTECRQGDSYHYCNGDYVRSLADALEAFDHRVGRG